MRATPGSMFQNIFRIFHLLMLISFTSAGMEHANSAFKLVKTVSRSNMHQDRLSALVLRHVDKDIKLDIQVIIDTSTNGNT